MTEEREKYVKEALAEYGKKKLFEEAYNKYGCYSQIKNYESFVKEAIYRDDIPDELSFNDILEIFDKELHEEWDKILEERKEENNNAKKENKN